MGRRCWPLTVEPVIFLTFFSTTLVDVITQKYIYTTLTHKTDTSQEGFCEKVNCYNSSDLEHVGRGILCSSSTDYWLLFINLASLLLAIPSTIIFGTWSETEGRKIVLVASLLGIALRVALVFIIIHFQEPLYFFVIVSLMTSALGYSTSLMSSCMAYVADITSRGQRTFRILFLDSAAGIGIGLAYFVCGFYLERVWFYHLLWLGIAACIMNIIYIVFYLEESLLLPGFYGSSTIFSCQDFLKICRVFTHEPGNGRRWRLLTYVASFVVAGIIFTGTNSLLIMAVYLFFRYYLTNDHDYGTPMPAAFIHENVLRPLKSFPSVKLTVSPNELFEKLYYHKIRTTPGTFHEPSWHKTKNDFVTKLGDSSEKGDEFIPNSLIGLQEKKFDGSQDDILVEETSTKGKTYSSLIAPNQVNNSMNLSLLHSISDLQRTSISSSTILHRYQDFRSEWFRQRRARLDWRSMIQPCIDNLPWGLVKNQWGKTNRSSAAASEIVYQEIKPAGEFSKIFIQSKTVNNQTKLIGGDTWRVYLRGPSSVAATVFDHQNGTYEALFLLTEPGIYQLLIFLDYSLCDGFKDPPPDWFIQGNAQGKYQRDGLLGTLDDYLNEPFRNGNRLTITIPKAQLNTTFIGR